MGIYLAVQAGNKGYFDDGVIQSLYIVTFPSMLFGVAMIGEYWVTNLPPQVRTVWRSRVSRASEVYVALEAVSIPFWKDPTEGFASQMSWYEPNGGNHAVGSRFRGLHDSSPLFRLHRIRYFQ